MTGAVVTGRVKHVEFVRSYGGCYVPGERRVVSLSLADQLIADGYAKHLPSQFDPPEAPPKPQFMQRKKDRR